MAASAVSWLTRVTQRLLRFCSSAICFCSAATSTSARPAFTAADWTACASASDSEELTWAAASCSRLSRSSDTAPVSICSNPDSAPNFPTGTTSCSRGSFSVSLGSSYSVTLANRLVFFLGCGSASSASLYSATLANLPAFFLGWEGASERAGSWKPSAVCLAWLTACAASLCANCDP